MLREQPLVVFVTMPFTDLIHPSLGLSLLQAAMNGAGIPSKTLYVNLMYAAEKGTEFYEDVCSKSHIENFEAATLEAGRDEKGHITSLVGDWIFAGALSSMEPSRLEEYRRLYLLPGGEEFADAVVTARGEATSFAERIADRIISLSPRIVGFTSVFQQHVASLALAKLLKARAPELTILFGGANCESIMGAETIRRFEFVDAVVSGEGDLIIAELVARILDGKPIDDVPGVYTRANLDRTIEQGCGTAPSVVDMDALPFPDFSDFFEQLSSMPAEATVEPRLLFETSRGCWWGAKHHCTFCGLNGTTMRYRSKSAARAMHELQWLCDTYATKAIGVTDNILDMKYFADFIPELSRRNLGLDLFYETKANLTKEQLRQLKSAGITQLQPGIESLSTSVLKLMDKGIRGLQNVQLLKWCKQLGIAPAWNFLWGFPGESEEEYAALARLVPLLSHLRPPEAAGIVRLDRFSPNFDRAAEYGFTNVRPYPSYSLVYDLDEGSVYNLAYYFTFDYKEARDVERYTALLRAAVADWRRAHVRSELLSVDLGGSLLIIDHRTHLPGRSYVLSGAERATYRRCDGIASLAQIEAAVREAGFDVAQVPIAESLSRWENLGLILREDSGYLALAIPLGDYVPGEQLYAHMRSVAAALEPAVA